MTDQAARFAEITERAEFASDAVDHTGEFRSATTTVWYAADVPWLLAELARVSREAEQLREAVENLCEDVDEALRLDETLPAEMHRLGGILLGYGGGHNHLADLRAALAAAGDRP